MTTEPLRVLQEGIALQQSGNLRDARSRYAQIPANSPYYADALNLLGTVHAQSGDLKAAAALMQRAVRANPRNVTAWTNLGSVLRDSGGRGPAEACLRRALLVGPDRIGPAVALESVAAGSRRAWVQRVCLVLDPVNEQVRIERANALAASARFAPAVADLTKCLVANPAQATAAFNLANIHRDTQVLPVADRLYRRALVLRPDDGRAWNNWGLLAFKTTGLPEARRRLALATRKTPQLPQGWLNYARAVQLLEGDAAAVAPMRRGLLLDPANAGAACEIAGLAQTPAWARHARCLAPLSHRPYVRIAQFGAEPSHRYRVMHRLRQAALAEPDAPDGWYHLAVEAARCEHRAQAIRYSRFATLIRDDRANARLNSALFLLLLERFDVGWEAHRHRLETPESKLFRRRFAIPEWDGGPISGGHLLLWGEQGIGDEVQFLTLAPALLERGVRLTILTEPRLRPILRRSFPINVAVPDVERATGEVEDHFGADCHLALGDLPHRLGLFCGGDATPRPWIMADPTRAAELRSGLTRRHPGKLLVGITWRSVAPKTGARRTIAPAEWRGPASLRNVALVSLQYGATEADRAAFRAGAAADLDLEHGVEPLNSLDDLVSLIAAVDLVICPANNTVHFAGAMARPCWTLLPVFPDWRWGLAGAGSRWYPAMRVFRQSQEGRWQDVMAAVHRGLLDYRPTEAAGRIEFDRTA